MTRAREIFRYLAATLLLVVVAPIGIQAADAPAVTAGPAPTKGADGMWTLPDGTPTYHVAKDGTVDWYTASGFLRYGANCLQCHGPDGLGSSYAPDLTQSLKGMDLATFEQIVSGGKQTKEGDTDFVMPALGTNKNVMCYINDIYVYLKARSDGAVGRGRPDKNEAPSKDWEKAQDDCMG